MAHTKSGGSTRNYGDSISKRLGVKLFAGEPVAVGEVIIRQRGSKYLPGKNVAQADDDTLYAMKNGIIKFSTKRKKRFDRSLRTVSVVSVQ